MFSMRPPSAPLRRSVVQGVFARPAAGRPQGQTVQAGGAVKPGVAIQRRPGVEAFRVDLRQKSGGWPLPRDVQAKMEAALGANFSNVRIHVGPEASAIGAIAFTWGSDIHFAPGQYNPHTPHGQSLLGHELAHVVQQGAGRVANPFGSGVAVVQDQALEAEADRLGRMAAMSRMPDLAAAANPSARAMTGAPAISRKANPVAGYALRAPQPPGAMPAGSQTVQRYNVVGAAKYGLAYNNLRVSDDGKMAVRDTGDATPKGSTGYQDLYLASDVFNSARATLNLAGSGVTLTQSATTIVVHKKTLYKIDIQYSDTTNNASYSGCNANMWHVMGTQRDAKATTTLAHGVFAADVNGSRLISSEYGADAFSAVFFEITGKKSGGSKAKEEWADIGSSDRKRAAKRFGISQYAKPETGEGIGIFQMGRGGSHSKAMAHYAAVLAHSGGDYITIENYASGNDANPDHSDNFLFKKSTLNPNWYVRMFGAKKQSFHAFHKKYEGAEYGSDPIAVRYRAV
jgi:hypothetical protein